MYICMSSFCESSGGNFMQCENSYVHKFSLLIEVICIEIVIASVMMLGS